MKVRGSMEDLRTRRTAKDWVKDPNTWRQQYPLMKREIYTARLTVDITPELRRKLRAVALQADCTMSVMVRRLLEAQLKDQPDPGAPADITAESRPSPIRQRESP